MPRLTTRSTYRSSRSSQPSVEKGASSVTVVLSTFASQWFTQALVSLQSQLAEARSAASEAVIATQMLSADICQLKRSSATSSAPPPKLPKLSKQGLAVQQGFSAGIIQVMDNVLSALPEGSEEAAKYLLEAPQRSNDCFLCSQRWQVRQGKRDQLASSSTHGHQQEATSTIPQPPGCPRATPHQPPLNDFNPLSAAGFEALPLTLKLKEIKLADFVLCFASPC